MTTTIERSQLSTASRIPVTGEGLALMRERLHDIDEVRLPQLRALLIDRDRDERDVAAYERLVAEREELAASIDLAEIITPVRGRGPVTLSLGMRARVLLADGSRTWVRPVHPVEAHLDDERISMDSPLAKAIMGARRGAVVEVHAPTGNWDCTVLSIEVPRDHHADAAA